MFEIKRILNKRIIKKGYGEATEYFVRWKGYGPEYDRYYNIKDLNNARKLIDDYKKKIANSRYYSSDENTAVVVEKPKTDLRQKKGKMTRVNNVKKKKTERKRISALRLEFPP